MTKIKNLVGSPFDVQTLSGPAIIEAFGTLEAEFEPGYLDLLLTCRNIVIDDEAPAKPASVAEPKADEFTAAEQYELLTGKKPDGRWSDERLAEEIAKLEA